jgi:hypothetical protein
VTASTVVLLSTLALAKKPPTGPDPDAVAAEEAATCAAGTVEGFRIVTGYATDPDPAQAVQLARADARKQALTTLCSGKSEGRCEIIGRHLDPWKVPYHNPLTQRACFHVGIKRTWIDDDRGDQQAFVRDLGTLAAAIHQAATDRPVALAPVLWARSGCVAGEAADAVHAELRNALGRLGGLTLVPEAGDSAVEIRLSLEPGATGVALTAAAVSPRGAGEVPLPGFSFPDDLFDLGADGGDCRFDDALGLTSGQRRGHTGLVVRMALGTEERRFCEGDRVTPELRVSRPATVKVFSVSRSGTALLVWPPAGETGLVQDRASLGPMDLVLTSTPGDEKLLAVAMPQGEPFAGLQDWTGLCRYPGDFTAGAYPDPAAASAATFSVLAWDDDHCLQRDVRPAGTAEIPPLPACPETWSP